MVHRLVYFRILHLKKDNLTAKADEWVSAAEIHLFSFSSMSEALASLLGMVGAT